MRQIFNIFFSDDIRLRFFFFYIPSPFQINFTVWTALRDARYCIIFIFILPIKFLLLLWIILVALLLFFWLLFQLLLLGLLYKLFLRLYTLLFIIICCHIFKMIKIAYLFIIILFQNHMSFILQSIIIISNKKVDMECNQIRINV